MMNMMTGAVAINGGVGVMEVRQSIAKNVAQAAEQMAADLAVNAHITLRELKTKIDTVVEKKLPTFKTLMEKEPVAVAQTMVNGAKLTAYENGYLYTNWGDSSAGYVYINGWQSTWIRNGGSEYVPTIWPICKGDMYLTDGGIRDLFWIPCK